MSVQSKIVGSLTVKQLKAALASFPRLSEEGKRASEMVLVKGIEQSEVAKTFGIHRQQVNKWCKDIYLVHKNIPKGWLVAEVTLPPDLMKEVKNMERKARRSLEKP